MLNQAAVVALNHLLVQSGWALPRLLRFSGKTVHFHVAPFTLSCTVQHDGSLKAASATDSIDATCTFSPALLPRLALHDESALESLVTAGDAALIAEIVYLMRNLRWDAAEDLSRLVGDVAAERTVQFVQARTRKNADAVAFSLGLYDGVMANRDRSGTSGVTNA